MKRTSDQRKCWNAAAVQMKFRSTLAENVEFILRQIAALARRGVSVVLFPECAVTGYHVDFLQMPRREIEEGLQRIARQARDSKCNVLVGSPTFAGRKRYNSVVVFDSRGNEVFCYSKIHLTFRDTQYFVPGNSIAYFEIDGIPCTTIICHERRYPELVRLPVMMGAQVLFHPNAGLDSLGVSKSKRNGRDGISIRAFENEIYYVFANSVGSQGDGLWSAGDSKIVAPNGTILGLANHRDETSVCAELDLGIAGRKYAREAMKQPKFLRRHWQTLLKACWKRLE